MITSDIHTHTQYFHGKNTVKEMYALACEKNLKILWFLHLLSRRLCLSSLS